MSLSIKREKVHAIFIFLKMHMPVSVYNICDSKYEYDPVITYLL